MDLLLDFWIDILSFIPAWFSKFLYIFFEFCVITAFMFLVVLILVLAERKILALFQLRKGPNRVGLYRCLQTIADAFKLLLKEDVIPKRADKVLYTIAPLLTFVPVLFVWLLVPYGSASIVYNEDTSLLLFIAVMSIPILGKLLTGFASRNKYSSIGALRAVIQGISYEIPLLLSCLSVVYLAGTLNLEGIVEIQNQNGILSWFFIPSFLGMIIFSICALAELNRTPFDFPEAESELVAGYNVEYSGMKFAMLFLAEYAALFIVAAFMATLFFGGYSSPFGIYIADFLNYNSLFTAFVYELECFFWLMAKTTAIILVIFWIRATLPRFTPQKLTELSFKYLIPLSLMNLLIIGLIKIFLGGGYDF